MSIQNQSIKKIINTPQQYVPYIPTIKSNVNKIIDVASLNNQNSDSSSDIQWVEKFKKIISSPKTIGILAVLIVFLYITYLILHFIGVWQILVGILGGVAFIGLFLFLIFRSGDKPMPVFIIYLISLMFFLGITSLIVLSYFGEKFLCGENSAGVGSIFLIYGFIVIGVLIFNLIFMNGDSKNKNTKIISLILYYLATYIFIKVINASVDYNTANGMVTVLKGMLIPSTIYMICFNNLLSKYF